MNCSSRHKFSLSKAAPGGALLLAGMLLAGCKGNTSSAAMPEPVIGKPPTVRAGHVKVDLHDADPLSSSAWRSAAWYDFAAPMSTAAATPPTRGAVLYDADHLYVAFVCRKAPAAGGDGGVAATDTVYVYLDPHGEGKELLQVAVDASPAPPRCTWFRASAAAQPRDDGSPDLSFPTEDLPLKKTDIWCVLREGTDRGANVWTATLGIPLSTLPGPLRAAPATGAAWKVNLLRTITTMAGGKRVGQVQSNLSPVYMDAQPVSPYRLAALRFVP